MQIVWHGLSCFEITFKTLEGEVILVSDPYRSETGLKLPRNMTADIIISTHNAEDANAIDIVQGNPFIIALPGEYEVRNVFLFGIQAPLKSGDRSHRLFVMEQEGIRIAHLGALDRSLTDKELEQLSHIDILMIPVGGGRVLSPGDASEVIGQIEPRVVIPMTHAVHGVKETVGTVDSFCKELSICRREEAIKYKVSRRDLPEEDMLIMNLERA